MSIQESTLDVLQLYWKIQYYEVKEYATGGLILTQATIEKLSKYELLCYIIYIQENQKHTLAHLVRDTRKDLVHSGTKARAIYVDSILLISNINDNSNNKFYS